MVEPRGAATLTQIQKIFAWLAVVARRPGLQVSQALHYREDISYDPVFAIKGCESCLMGMLSLIFSTAPIKLYFIICCQTPVLFKLQPLELL